MLPRIYKQFPYTSKSNANHLLTIITPHGFCKEQKQILHPHRGRVCPTASCARGHRSIAASCSGSIRLPCFTSFSTLQCRSPRITASRTFSSSSFCSGAFSGNSVFQIAWARPAMVARRRAGGGSRSCHAGRVSVASHPLQTASRHQLYHTCSCNAPAASSTRCFCWGTTDVFTTVHTPVHRHRSRSKVDGQRAALKSPEFCACHHKSRARDG